MRAHDIGDQKCYIYSLITFYYLYGWHSNCDNTEHRGLQLYEYKFGAIAVFHCSVIMHCFEKLVSDFFIYVQIETGIEFALSVWTQTHLLA